MSLKFKINHVLLMDTCYIKLKLTIPLIIQLGVKGE